MLLDKSTQLESSQVSLVQVDLEKIKYTIKCTFLDQMEMEINQIDHLPEICKSSSLFVDPSSRAFKSSATKTCKASGNKQIVHAYTNMNWFKLTVKEESYKHHQHNNIYGNIFLLM